MFFQTGQVMRETESLRPGEAYKDTKGYLLQLASVLANE